MVVRMAGRVPPLSGEKSARSDPSTRGPSDVEDDTDLERRGARGDSPALEPTLRQPDPYDGRGQWQKHDRLVADCESGTHTPGIYHSIQRKPSRCRYLFFPRLEDRDQFLGGSLQSAESITAADFFPADHRVTPAALVGLASGSHHLRPLI